MPSLSEEGETLFKDVLSATIFEDITISEHNTTQ